MIALPRRTCYHAGMKEAILHRLLTGDTIYDAALKSAVHDDELLRRIRKCRHDCALFADKQQVYDSFRQRKARWDGGAFRQAVRSLFDAYTVRLLLTTRATTVCYAGTLPE